MALGAGAWFLAGPTAGAGFALFGSLLDIDHLELYASKGMPTNALGLLHAFTKDQRRLEKRYGFRRGVPASWSFPVLHCAEIVILTAAAGVISDSMFLYGVSAGILVHQLMDLKAYPMSPGFFSIIWRRRHWTHLRMAWKTWNT
jgi:hypothetical protein